jgi:uncharacterized protein YnzC (UPF0291/DUF896 family)
MEDKTKSYSELTTAAYQTFVEAVSSANERALGFTKSLFEITTRPYASTEMATLARENFDRLNQIVSLSISELQTNGSKAAELNTKVMEHGSKLQEAYVSSLRGAVDTGISNMQFVKDTTAQQMDEIAKRMDDVRTHATAQSSSN